MKSWRNKIALLAILAVFGLASSISKQSSVQAEPQVSGEIPLLSINLANTTLEEIKNGDKDTKYPGNEATFTINGENYDFFEVEIKGRGNSTWYGQEKKPFQLKFTSKENFFGLGAAKTWVLLANHHDDSHLRNDAAYFFANMLEEDFVTGGEYIELAIDGESQGLYYLTHKVEIAESSVNLTDPFGILFEFDNAHPEDCFYTERLNCLTLKDAVSEKDVEILNFATKDFLEDYNNLEEAAENRDWETLQSLIDVESFAEYYLISEFTANPDAYFSSHYFYKNGLDDKIHAGPAWDFDLAFSNCSWGEFSPVVTEQRKPAALGEVESPEKMSPIFFELNEIPEFQEATKSLFLSKVSGKKDFFMEHLTSQADRIRTLALKNNEQWQKNDLDYSTKKLTAWIEARYNYLEKVYAQS